MSNAKLHLLKLSEEAEIIFLLFYHEKDIDANGAKEMTTKDIRVKIQRDRDYPVGYDSVTKKCRSLKELNLLVCTNGFRGEQRYRLAPKVKKALECLDFYEVKK